jgi:hypothetical protein
MSPTDVRLIALRVEIERDWQQVKRHAQSCATTDPSVGAPEAALVALSLDHAYQAFEQVLCRIEQALHLPERSGQHWHRRLLADATESLPGVRPAIVPQSAERHWEELLGFRHFLRAAYAVELDPQRLSKNVEHLRAAVGMTEPAIADLLRVLHPDDAP